MSDETVEPIDIEALVREVIEKFPDQVAMYQRGGPMLGFLLGQVMKASGGKANAADAQDALVRALRE